MENEKSFEEMIIELEDIVKSLEKDNLNLDESINKFENGMKLAKDCNKKIEEAEKRITILLNENHATIYRPKEAKKEGINIVYLTRVIRGSGENGDLKEENFVAGE